MKGHKQLFSNKSDEWETPQDLFDELNREFDFYGDLAANEKNSKCAIHVENAFSLDRVFVNDLFYFCNPPYSRCKDFVKLVAENKLNCVMLLPARTDTKWFHEYVYNKPNVEIRFIKGRLKFSNSKNSAPFPSMIAIFYGDK